MLCSIYKITNTINNKIYIGQTWESLQRRFKSHKALCHKTCTKLYNALNKHGRDNFSIEFLTVCGTQETADYWEIYFIRINNTIEYGYNLREGGAKGKVSKETRAKISLSLMKNKRGVGNKNSLGKKNGLGNKSTLGKKASTETKAKKSAAMKGKTWKVINGVRVYFTKDTISPSLDAS